MYGSRAFSVQDLRYRVSGFKAEDPEKVVGIALTGSFVEGWKDFRAGSRIVLRRCPGWCLLAVC